MITASPLKRTSAARFRSSAQLPGLWPGAQHKANLAQHSAVAFSRPQCRADILKLEFPADLKHTHDYCRAIWKNTLAHSLGHTVMAQFLALQGALHFLRANAAAEEALPWCARPRSCGSGNIQATIQSPL